MTDINGNVTDTYTYDAFGNLLDRTGTTPNNYLYNGEQFDPDLGCYYFRARYYNPQSGRFMSQDPFEGFISMPLSLHKYLYVYADPVNLYDPSGRQAMVEYGIRTKENTKPETTTTLTAMALRIACTLQKAASVLLSISDALAYTGVYQNQTISYTLEVVTTVNFCKMEVKASPNIIPQRKMSWRKKRDIILRDNPPCKWCRKPSSRNGRPGHVDHKVPKSKPGSTDDLENLQPSCEHCNTSRGNREYPKTPPIDYTGPWPPPWW